MKAKFLVVLVASILLPVLLYAQQWELKKAPLMTKYSECLTPEKVLSEYPRPQLVRQRWFNLNGLWEFQPGIGANEPAPSGKLSGTILVPFPVESALSGVKGHYERLWYRRKFIIPANWRGQRVLLHFGAVDYETEVFVNGKSLGIHTGGYDPFSFDITPFVKSAGEQEVIVRVFDPTDAGGFPRGKQSLKPGGIMYTSTTGIWQTVWLEPVPVTSIDDIKIVPDVDRSVVKVTVNTQGNTYGLSIIANVTNGKEVIKTVSGKANTEIIIPVPSAKLWSPDSPFLYDLGITLKKGHKTIDEVASYFGMRKISIAKEGGFKKIFLNNKFLFQIGPLDQGFWPDGIYTAPSDEAIKYDLQTIKALGFNMVRKHIKVEPYRWYYWADKLGLMVWQDMPSVNSYTNNPVPIDTAAFSSQLTRLVKTHWNSPCIVMWVIFNESQGQHNTAELVKRVRALDPSRLIDQASGSTFFGVGDVLDLHTYPPPGCLVSSTQAIVCGEYGGIGYKIKGHLWDDGFGYIAANNQKEYDNIYNSFANDLIALKTNRGLSAAVYTQITDVEAEINGLMTYDRAVIKGNIEAIKTANTNAINKKLYMHTVLPLSEKVARTWKYTFIQPDTNFYKTDFNDLLWKSGEAEFGTKDAHDGRVRTIWGTKDIWLRQEFTVGNLSAKERDNLVLYLHHSVDFDIYINGIKAADIGIYTSGYTIVAINKAASGSLISNGKNVIAIHCKQDGGAQYLDAGISVLSPVK